MSIKAVIFDIDGVLVDSKDSNVAFIQLLLERGGYRKPSREDVLTEFHQPLWQTLEHLMGTSDEKEIKRVWDMAQDPVIRRLRPLSLFRFPEGLHDLLEALGKQYELAVVTSRLKVGMEEVLEASNIGHFFSVVVAFEDYANPKPHPEPLLVAAEWLRIKPAEAIYVGDSLTDIEAAKSAGMHSIHLADSHHADATAGIREFHEILEAVQTIAS